MIGVRKILFNMINNFTIFKKDAPVGENMPTHTLSAKIGDNYAQIGSGWTKTSSRGNFLSCQLNPENKSFTTKEGETVNLEAWVMITKEEYNFLKNCEKRVGMLTSPTDGHPAGIDMAKHPLNSEAEQKAYDKELEDIGF